MLRLAALLLCLVLVPAACGPLPRPFVPEGKAQNDLLALGDRAGIVVRPVAGDRPRAPQAVAEVMAARLRDLNVPAATVGGNRESPILHCRAVVRPLPGAREREEVILYWELRDHQGRRLGFHTMRRELPGGAWQRAEPEAIDGLVAAAAPAVAAMVQNPPVATAAIPGFPRARLVVLPVEGAPGDSSVSLPRALEDELLAADLPVADKIGEDDLLVLGEVELGPPEGGLQEVAVTWRVISAREDEDLGEVAQSSRVPAGSLDGPWGRTAREIARGAAAGVIDLLDRISKP